MKPELKENIKKLIAAIDDCYLENEEQYSDEELKEYYNDLLSLLSGESYTAMKYAYRYGR